ncbi:MAG: MFS transporter [Candidatus Bathyarchaeota archaeon]|nr:MFS transporter [Candidatus Bathyarchaeota archaeon]
MEVDNLSLKRRIDLRVVAVPLIGYLILAMFRLSVGVIIPEVIYEFSLTEAEGGMLLTSLLGAMALIIIVGGHLSDRIGRKITMSIGFTIMSAGIIIGGYSVGYWALLISLFITGIGTGIFIVALYALMGEVMPTSRGALVGFANGLFAIGGFLGPWISAILIMKLGWRSPFHLIGALAVALSFFLWFNSRSGLPRREARKKPKEGFLILLKDTRVILLCIAMGIGNFAFASLAAWTPSYLMKIGNLHLSEAGFAFGLFSLTGALGAVFFGMLSDRIGRRGGILASGIPAFIFTLLYFSGYIVSKSMIVLSGVLGFITYAFWNLMIAAVQDHVDSRLLGSATGLMLNVGMIGAVPAPMIAGLIITNYGFNLALILTVAIPQLLYTIAASKAIP